MSLKRRLLRRPFGERRYRKLFLISAEGIKTEPQYFAIFNSLQSILKVNCLKGNHESSPLQVLEKMRAHIKEEGLKDSDEAWIVMDKDQWTDEQLVQLYIWSQKKDNYGFALSNPHFEYWLLLHFEDGKGISTSRDCLNRLRQHLSDYDKNIDAHKFTQERIGDAIRRAKERDNPPCEDWPRCPGRTTVYRLVERILELKG